MLSNKNYDNQSNILIDSITSNTQASFNNSSFTGVLTLPSGQIVTVNKELVDLNSVQTLTNKTLTKAQVGLDNVDNSSDLSKPISTLTQTALNLKANQSSISNIDNISDVNKPISTATQTALNLKANQSSISNIDNISDVNKPISTATQTALNLKANLASPTFTGTVTLPSTQQITSSVTLVDLNSTQTLTNKSFNISLPSTYYSPTSTQLGYILNGTTTSTNNVILSTTVSTQLITLTLPAGVWMVSGQIEYFCYSTTSLSFSQITSSILPNVVSGFTNNIIYSQNLLSGTLTTNNSIIQQVQGIFNINATPALSNNVLNLTATCTFSAGNVLVKCKNSTTTATTTTATSGVNTFVITATNANIVVGMIISGVGVINSPIVVSVSTTTITMNSTQTIGASTVLTFTNVSQYSYLNAVRIG